MFALLFGLITFAWLLELIIHRPDRSYSSPPESITLRLIWLAIALSITVSALSAHFDIALISTQNESIWQSVGLIVYALGVSLRWYGIHVLGEHFSRHIRVTEQTELVSNGPYRWLAHPLYFAILLCLSGIGIALNSWLGLLGVWFIALPAILYRIRLEEQKMIGQFGSEYSEWLKKRSRLIPFIF